MAKLGAGSKVCAPHIFEVSCDVSAAEQTFTLYEVAVLRRLVLRYEGRVGVCTVDLHRLIVAKEFQAC